MHDCYDNQFIEEENNIFKYYLTNYYNDIRLSYPCDKYKILLNIYTIQVPNNIQQLCNKLNNSNNYFKEIVNHIYAYAIFEKYKQIIENDLLYDYMQIHKMHVVSLLQFLNILLNINEL